MNASPSVRVYGQLLRLYPRPFRDAYGPDMVQLFADQLNDEPAARVWARGVVDLAMTAPARHLEARMHRSPTALVALLFAAVCAAGVMVALIAGSNLGLVAGSLAVAAPAGILAVLSGRQTRTIATPGSTTAQWWKLVAVGLGALFALVLAEGATDINLWMPMVITVLMALLLIAGGLVLGAAHLVTRHARHAAG